MRETAFLILLFLGILALVGGVGLTRFNWRPDVQPYGRHTHSLDVLLHPERYAQEHALRGIQTLNMAGMLLLACAAGILTYEAFRSILGQ